MNKDMMDTWVLNNLIVLFFLLISTFLVSKLDNLFYIFKENKSDKKRGRCTWQK